MVNPAPRNTYATTPNLVAACQMIQPGETARLLATQPAALRRVLDAANDVYTVVDGKRVDMTPVMLCGPHLGAGTGMPTKAVRRRSGWISWTCLSCGTSKQGLSNTIPGRSSARWSATRPYDSSCRPEWPHSVEIAKDVMPTIGLLAMRLPSGTATQRLQETANNLYAAVTGNIRATIDGREHQFLGRGDVLTVPLCVGHAAWRRGCDLVAGH
jgi:hypothetical protein